MKRVFSFLIALSFIASLSCVSTWQGVGMPATHKTQGEATIKIYNTCLYPDGEFRRSGGSGVAISPTMVLTAYHVVDCPTEVQAIIVERKDGQQYLAELDTSKPAEDLARLKLADEPDAHFPTYVTRLGYTPDTDDVICSESAIPGWNRKCGWVEKRVDMPNGDIRHSAINEPGNSGSGVYNEDGELVGIVTMLYFCPNLDAYGVKQVCGGYVSSLWKSRHLMY